MKDLFRENRRAASSSAAWWAFSYSAVLQACQLQDIIKFDVPPAVADAVETEPKVPVSQSERVWEDWVAWVDSRATGSSSRSARVRRGWRGRVADEHGDPAGPRRSEHPPGGALISTGLALMGGLFLKRPGDRKREEMEKEASYQAGLDKGQRIADSVKQGIAALREQQGRNGSQEV